MGGRTCGPPLNPSFPPERTMMSIFMTPPESGKKSDVNGGRKLANDLTPQQRDARIARLAQFYGTPRLGDPSPFGDTGLALTPQKGEDFGPMWATPEECPLDEGPSEEGLFSVDCLEFVDPSTEGAIDFNDYLNS